MHTWVSHAKPSAQGFLGSWLVDPGLLCLLRDPAALPHPLPLGLGTGFAHNNNKSGEGEEPAPSVICTICRYLSSCFVYFFSDKVFYHVNEVELELAVILLP